jgi:hypothetical protein
MKLLHIAMLFALVAVGVSSTYSQEAIPKDLEITLERTMCFGWCPAYTLTIAANGTVNFTPTGNYSVRGDGSVPTFPLTGTVTLNQLKVLIAEFEKIHFYSLRNRYGRKGSSGGGPSCPHYATDNPGAYITIVISGRRKTVSHYLGCEGSKVLDDLVTLEEKIDEMAGTTRWTSQFGWGTGSVTDLKLTVNRSNRSMPDKP